MSEMYMMTVLRSRSGVTLLHVPPNVEHWHGATPKEPLVQVNIQFGGTTKWLTKTTDDEYNGRK